MTVKRPLKELLAMDPDSIMDEDKEAPIADDTTTGGPSFASPGAAAAAAGLCIECGDQPAQEECTQCQESFCDVCFGYLHRTGKRRTHTTRRLGVEIKEKPEEKPVEEKEEEEDDDENDDDEENDDNDEENEDEKLAKAHRENQNAPTGGPSKDSVERVLERIRHHAAYVPMRLTLEERKLLRLLEAALNVSEYTDRVDVLSYTSAAKRIVVQLREMCAILAGLVVATDMATGREMFETQDFAASAEWFQAVFEVGRRYKIMNPEKMRDSFGKLMYMIMDSRLPEVRAALEFDFYKPIQTVYGFLKAKSGDEDGEGVLRIFNDPLLVQATMEIIPDNKSRAIVQRDIKRKESAIKLLSKKYASNSLFRKSGKGSGVTPDEICQCLYSLGDYHAYLRANRHPVEEMIRMLTAHFSADLPTSGDELSSLSIYAGRGGSRLSHSHTKQFLYVQQSLALWSYIMQDMFWLWTLADDDLTSTSARYTLADTGQGLNRVKACPRVGRAMHSIIAKTQSRTGAWIGSSVVHLGDRAVPNALFFLDKYLQVPRILTPVYLAIKHIESPSVSADPHLRAWIDAQFGSIEQLKRTILCDFFKHGFDGSGADNFYDAGSCIDGRLTSAWSWANSIAKKPYYKIFLVTGFSGFNGSDGF
ncbi:uncharacterized protein SAPINGB_P002356 [Magnusiomyces paraingens]|uniref:Non-canonical E2 ubiquitin-conjugating enzyme C-terminal domain-containing protein n=1 Tax=Magnusiomyces paraingens TaxID=2606893 RepID=A0A5E8BDE6_9ASCO|nr:uncharacterized protein SAPINGB_P002356 [Saprochaete ingens]VVT49613.1 unnamed protein product [Saprochaete ingens]